MTTIPDAAPFTFYEQQIAAAITATTTRTESAAEPDRATVLLVAAYLHRMVPSFDGLYSAGRAAFHAEAATAFHKLSQLADTNPHGLAQVCDRLDLDTPAWVRPR